MFRIPPMNMYAETETFRYAPILDALIADHEEAQRKGTSRDRARRVLDAYGPVSRS